ncbi:MAG: PadR family transcriptional regulator [Erysipelotrichales bacterium]|nr:PadR family transcriptional regulator [Erysipelotrichales bacterium]
MNPQLKKGALELCVLSQLIHSDKYGYELTETISEVMTIATGTLYLVLKRLKDEEYVDTYLVESMEGPARKYYRLTDKGRIYQSELKAEWESFTEHVAYLIRKGETNE